jgi:hypothetical protein
MLDPVRRRDYRLHDIGIVVQFQAWARNAFVTASEEIFGIPQSFKPEGMEILSSRS